MSVELLMGKAFKGELTPGEAAQLSKMLDSPALKDAFTPQQRQDLQKFADGRGLPPRDPQELHSNLKLLKSLNEVPGRFAADLVLGHEALLEHAALLRADKASRLFQFAVPYAQELVENAKSPQELKAAANALLLEAEKAGFKQLERQPDGADGLKALRELLRAGSAEELARLASRFKFDAPSWPKDPVRQQAEALPPELQVHKSEAQTMRPPSPVLQPPVPIQQRKVDEADGAPAAHDDRTDKKLGGSMIWNVLHRFRGTGESDDQESAAQRDQMNQLMVVAGLILVFMAVVIGVLVAL